LAVIKKIVEKVADKKALINLKTSDGITPLHLAALIGALELVEYFISEGANINDFDINGFTRVPLCC
jgi:ankyrin repeat protein